MVCSAGCRTAAPSLAVAVRRRRPSARGRLARRGSRPSVGPAGALEEHRAEEVGPLEEVGGGPGEPDLALLHEVRRLGHGERHVHRLLHEDDRGALRRAARAGAGRSCSTITGARPIDSSSIMSSRGFERNAMPRASCCCWPPERLAAGSCWRVSSTGNRPSTRSIAARAAFGVAAVQPAGHLEVLADGERREGADPARHLEHAAPGDLRRVAWPSCRRRRR